MARIMTSSLLGAVTLLLTLTVSFTLAKPGVLEELPEAHRIVLGKLLDEAVKETNKSPIELVRLALQSEREQRLRDASSGIGSSVSPSTLPPTSPASVQAGKLEPTSVPVAFEEAPSPAAEIKIQIEPSEPNPVPKIAEAPEPPVIEGQSAPAEPSALIEPVAPVAPTPPAKPTMPKFSFQTMPIFEADPVKPVRVAKVGSSRVENPRRSAIDETYIDKSDPKNPKKVRVTQKDEVNVSPDGGSRSEIHQSSQSSTSLGDDPNHFSHSSSSSFSSSSSSHSASINGKPVAPEDINLPGFNPFGFMQPPIFRPPRLPQTKVVKEQTRNQQVEEDEFPNGNPFGQWPDFPDPSSHMAAHSQFMERFGQSMPQFESSFARRSKPKSNS